MLKCLRCDFLYHEKCYGKKVVVCATCDKEIESEMKN